MDRATASRDIENPRAERALAAGFRNNLTGSACGQAVTIPKLSEKNLYLERVERGINPPDDVNVFIEISVGGAPIKYEFNKSAGVLMVDRFLYTSMVYPGNYGFIPRTLGDDGDPLDVIICNDRPLIPGSVINVRPIGVLTMEDEAGMDEKVLAIPSPHLTRKFDGVSNFDDIPEITLLKIAHFFAHYKDLEPGKWSKTGEWNDAKAARSLIQMAIERYDGQLQT